MIDLYVYYKVRELDAAALAPRVRALQAHIGVPAQLKRRMTLATLPDAAARPGDEVYSVEDPDQPSGMIVNAAPNGAGGADALVEIKLAALDGDVRHGSAGGTKLDFLPLPYPLDAVDA
jgi:hypothetical protein